MAACSRRVLLFSVILSFCVINGEEAYVKKNAGDKTLERFKRRNLEPGQNNVIPAGDAGQRFPYVKAGDGDPQNHIPIVKEKLKQLGGQRPGMKSMLLQQNPQLGAQMDQNNNGKNPARPLKKAFKLAETTECAEDIITHCSRKSMKNNFAVLDCLQRDPKVAEDISPKCQNFVWQYKMNLTKDDRFEYAADEVCVKELKNIPECGKLQKGGGQIIPCLVENIENITDNNCRTYLNKMARIVFSDFRMVYGFVDECSSDIQAHQCGRLQFEDSKAVHSQGRTLHCLAKKISQLNPVCKKQLLRIAELQADDYHLDRPLFYACRLDRERFCESIVAGQGRVYECLFKHKFDADMSDECRDKLTVRQRLIAEDVKVEKSFFGACRLDIKENGCFSAGNNNNDDDARRASVLLCLENAHKRDTVITPECLAEMMDLRKTLMADFKINPEIVASCGAEINTMCEGGLTRGGKTIHCLMEHARNQHKKASPQLSPPCVRALESLVREADVGSDFRMDRNLQKACQEVVNIVCKDIHPGDAEVINCLMDHLDSEYMTDLCEEKLMQIQYFIVRDFRLDATLYKHCHQDAFKLCHAPKTWIEQDSTNVELGPMVLPCLFRYMKDHDTDPELQVTRACKHEILRVMRRRSKRVELDTEIERKCVNDLGRFCSDGQSDNYEKGEELSCLQDNYDDLEDDCQEIIGNITESQDTYLELDNLVMKSCMPMIKKFCREEMEEDADAEEVMDCLIENKHDPSMDERCAAGVEHHQIISLQDFRFSHKFKEACKENVMMYCKGKKSKYDVVACLSEHVRNDTVIEMKHRISKVCRKQLRFEVLQRGEKIDLDPELKKACKKELDTVCSGVEHGNAKAIECLKQHPKRLGDKCSKMIFVREKDDVYIGDFKLKQACAGMIKTYCKTVVQANGDVMHCLQKHKDETEFDRKCRTFVIKRQVIQNQDYRLNPSLKKSCKMDIVKFCNDLVRTEKNDVELEGKVINCLKKQFAVNRLSRDCNAEIRDVIKDAALNYLEDPVLSKACETVIATVCADEHNKAMQSENRVVVTEDGKGAVIECLKKNIKSIRNGKNGLSCAKEIARTIQEAHIDVGVDPLLHTACQQDLSKHCGHINPGNGRQMNCLLIELEDRPDGMSTDCRNLLSKRKDLWEFSVRVAPPEGFGEIYEQISISPAKNYILSIMIVVLGMIFLVGITCGRVTKRAKGDKRK
ncbi:Golgi apparatus protein 1-like [Mizuhopecten yessoensis]|uniref:Golgi apparatus protein 1 n=1 Tax=Mizuhopecten yessoensis TaxID=6573 RepID=A0A210Q8K7_MIZYE|nr:Golgi apparatus protein 1-like [Mizuhopecten yessoensis]OWF45073.1 Golgi apparatus protein 1 [Mizuhopecten yessoensis]